MERNLVTVLFAMVILNACTSPAVTPLPVSTATALRSSTLTPTSVPSVIPMATSQPTTTPRPTNTLVLPTNTVVRTSTPRPTNTPLPELTIANVGLVFSAEEILGTFMIIPCYLFTPTMFHAGDGVYFPRGDTSTKYNVKAPADGKIMRVSRISDRIGWEINVQTPYVLDGAIVFYDVLHTSGLRPGLNVGDNVRKGDNLAIKMQEHLDPGGNWLVDIGFRNGYKQANASLPDWTGLGYISYYRLIQDDLALLDLSRLTYRSCDGNPIEQNKPYSTPTPGGLGPYIYQK